LAAASRRAFPGAHGAAPAARWCASTSSSSAEPSGSEPPQRWDITAEKWVEYKFLDEDYARFPVERARFREEPRLKLETVAQTPALESIDTMMAIRGGISSFRLGDCYTTEFEEVIWERLAEVNDLLKSLKIPLFEDKNVVSEELHSKAVPGEGAYLKVRTQSYWLALHIWLIHFKQHAVQEGEGLFVSALCALLTRRLFEFQWNRIRMFMHTADVPVMSVSNELQDMQEFIFGLCVALDDVFREEAASGTADALLKEDADLSEGRLGLAPRLKYVLWANVYNGAIEHDDESLYELTVYMLRQRMLFEGMDRNAFLSGKFQWAEHPILQKQGA
jgi:hypothetical protein